MKLYLRLKIFPELLFIVLLLVISHSVAIQASEHQGDSPLLSEKYDAGRSVYNYRCYYCHGYSGDAKTLAARFVTPMPRDFTSSGNEHLTIERMTISITEGRNGTAMPAFGNTLSIKEISDVIYYIQSGFISGKEKSSGYHTTANGWPDHQLKYGSAFPFVLGKLSVKTPETELSQVLRKGREIFFNGCITCHEVIESNVSDVIWEPRAVSFPRSHSPFREPDAITQATVYARHEESEKGNVEEKTEGYQLYQQNCAFCHSVDRTGKNWIGNFLEPHPRDLTDIIFLRKQSLESLVAIISLGVTESSMPRWDTVLSKSQIEKIACFLLSDIKKTPECSE